MYGLIGRIVAVEGKREALLEILSESAGQMPGCKSYIVARCGEHPDGIWVTEVWEDAESHKASLSLDMVQSAIGRARPLIAGFDHRFETQPVGVSGLH